MNDKEKLKEVISDLEEQIAWIRDNDFHKFPGWGHAVLAMRDALALLKAQEPVKPKFSRVYDYDISMFACGACGKEAGPEGMWNYCLHCGKAAKWE